MADVSLTIYCPTVSTAWTSINSVIINAGWILHDTVSATNIVYKSNGEEGIFPYIYLRIYTSATEIYFELYLYWDATAHTGTAKAYAGANVVYFNTAIWGNFAANKDMVFAATQLWGGYSVLVGFCNKLFYPNITNTTSLSSAGDDITLDVSSSSGIVKGQRIQIVGVDSEGRDQLQVTDVPDGTSVTVLNLPREYASGAFLGVTPCPAFTSSNTALSGYALCPRDAVGDANGDSGDDISIFSPLNRDYINPDYSSYYYLLTPLAVAFYPNSVSDSLIGYIDNDLIKLSPSGSTNDIFTINATGTPEQGVVTAATSNSITSSGKSWTVNEWANKRVVIVDGTGEGETNAIASNTSDTLTLTYNWTTTPDATSTFYIVDTAYRLAGRNVQYFCILEQLRSI